MSIQLNFKVRCQTSLEQSVFITGSIEELGKWDVHKGLSLSTNKDIYPLWIGSLSIDIEPSSIIEFKIAIVSQNQILWESIDNRVIEINYQLQNIIVSYNCWPSQIVRIRSFFDLSDIDPAELIGVQKRRLRIVPSPLDNNDSSSDFDSGQDDEGSGFGSLFNSVSKENSSNSLEFIQENNGYISKTFALF